MILVIITALAAVCSADKLEKTYLPPLSAKTAGGSPGFLQTPFARSLEQGSEGLPAGGFENDFQGVVVDAVNPGTRASGLEQTGLGAPRASYGSTDSKVGEAAFNAPDFEGPGDIASTRIAPGFGSFVYDSEESKTGQTGGGSIRLAPGFNYDSSDDTEAAKTQGTNTLKFNSDVSLNNYNYGYKTEEGIAVGQNGEAAGGVKAQGEYSYKGNDGKLYEVKYTADKNGYKPQGSHLPTPHPIPHDILVSLEKNAKDEAAGIVDDGSYDAQKYNDDGGYFGNNEDKHSQLSGGYKASGSFSSQTQTFNKPGSQAQAFGSSTAQQSQFGSGGLGTSGSLVNGQTRQSSQTGIGSPLSTSQFGLQSLGAKNQQDYKYNSNTKTENRFGSVPSDGSTLYSSAVSSGSGVASAFAQTGKSSNDFRGTDSSSGASLGAPTVATAANFGTENTFDGKSVASADSGPGFSTSFASVQGATGSAFSSSFNEGLKNHFNSNFPTTATASASVTPQAGVSFETKTQQFGSYPQGQFYRPYSSFPSKQGQNTFGSTFGGSNYQTGAYTKPGQNKFGSSTFGSLVKPTSFNQLQGPDSSYYYNQPSKPFASPVSPISSKFPSSSIQESKVSNTAASPTVASQTTSSTYNGVTQANISPFPSGSPTAPTSVVNQASLLGSKPTIFSPFNQQNSQTVGSNKPVFQSQTQTGQNYFEQSTIGNTVSSTQGYDGTIYEYNKPPKTLPTPKPDPVKPVDTTFSSVNNQGSSQFGSQSPLSSSSTKGSSQSIQNKLSSQSSGSQLTTFGGSQVSGSNFPQIQFGSSIRPQVGQKPFGNSQTSSYNFQQNQFESSSLFSQKPEKPQGSSFSLGTQSSQFGQKPTSVSQIGSTFQQTQFSSLPGQVSLKPQTTQTLTSTTTTQKEETTINSQKPFGSSGINFQESQVGTNSESQFGIKPEANQEFSVSKDQAVQTTQFGLKPQTGSNFQENLYTTFTGTQFNQKPQDIKDTSFTSTTTTTQKEQTTQFGQKPFGGTQTTGTSFQQNQSGSLSESQLGQKPFGGSQIGSYLQQSQFGTSGQKLQNSQFGQKPFSSSQTGSSFQQTQFSQKPGKISGGQAIQTSQFPIKTQTGSTFQQTQFGSSTGSFYGQKPQNTQGFVSTTTTQKENTQIGVTSGSQYGQKPQTGSNNIFNSGTVSGSPAIQTTQFPLKPQNGESIYQQNQFGSSTISQYKKPQTTYSTSAITTTQKEPSTQFIQKPISTASNTFQQSQFGLPIGSKLGQKPFGTTQTGSFFQQTSGSVFGQKPEKSQGTSFGTGTQSFQSQIGQKPSGNSQTGSYFQQGQSGSQFTQKPTQYQKPALISVTNPKGGVQSSQFSLKPQTGNIESQQNQFGSSTGSQFGQKIQTAQGSSFSSATTTTQKDKTMQFGQIPPGGSQTGFNTQQTGISRPQSSQKPESIKETFNSNTGSSGQTIQVSQFPQQNQVISTTESQFVLKPQYSQEQISQFNKKPFGSSQASSSQFGQTTQGSSFSSATSTTQKEQTVQFGQIPLGGSQTGFNTQQTQFGLSGPQSSQKPQSIKETFNSNTGSSGQTIQASQFPQQNQVISTTESQFVLKPQYSQEQISQFNKKPFGSSQISTSQLGQTTQGSSFSSTTSTTQKEQTVQFGQIPLGGSQTGFNTQQTQFGLSGPQSSQKPQSIKETFNSNTGSSGQTIQASQFPQQNQVISTTESQFVLKPQYSQEQISQFSNKPFGSSQASTTKLGQTQQGSSFSIGSTSQPQPSQQNYGISQVTGSTFEQTQSGLQLGQKQQNTQDSGYTTTTVTQKEQTTQFSQKPFGTSQGTGSESQKTQFSSTSASEFGQRPQNTQGSAFTSNVQSQLYQKPFSSQNISSNFQSNQFGASSSSKFGQTQTNQDTSTAGVPSNQGQSLQSLQKPFGNQNQNTQQNQFGSSTGSKFSSTATTDSKIQNQFGQKPYGAQTTGSSLQQSQGGSVFTSQSPVTNPKPQYGYKPFGSTQDSNQFSYQQTQFGSNSGSYFGKKPEVNKIQNAGTVFGSQTPQGSQFGNQAQKPFGSTSFQQNQFGSSSQFTQPQSNQASAFASSSGSNIPQFSSQYKPSLFNNKGSKFSINSEQPYNTQTQLTQSGQGSQTSFGSQVQQFGVNQQKPSVGVSGTSFQTQIGQSLGQKTQPTQGSIQVTGAPIQSRPSSFGFSAKPGSSSEGYLYQKPQTAFGITSGQQNGQNVQPTLVSSTPFVVSTTESSNFKESQSTVSQFGTQSTVDSNENNFGSTSRPQLGFQPLSGTTAFNVQPTQPTLFGSQTFKPFGDSQGSSIQKVQPGFGTSTFGVQSAQGSSQTASQSSKPQFGQGFIPVGSTQAPGFQANSQNSGAQISIDDLQGLQKEQFGGARDPPRFDDKTGYHY